MSLARANIFPCATFQVDKAQHTSRPLQQDLARCCVEFRILAEGRARARHADYKRLVRLFKRDSCLVTFTVTSRFGDSVVVVFASDSAVRV